MASFETRIDQAIRAAGVAIVSLRLGTLADKGTWLVQPSTLQSAAQPIIDAFDPNDPVQAAADVAAVAYATSRQKDILAMCALVVRARGIAAWNALTTQQKIDAAMAEADAWKTLRIFAENNL